MSTFVTVKEKTLARCRKMGSTINSLRSFFPTFVAVLHLTLECA